MIALLQAIFVVSVIVLLGFIAHHRLEIDRRTLTQLTVYILVPALVLDSLYHSTLDLNQAGVMLLAFALLSFALWAITLLLAFIFKLKPSIKSSLVAIALFSNNGNLGLPLVAFAFGEPGLERAIVYLIGNSLLVFGLGPVLLQEKRAGLGGLGLIIKLPLLWGMALGILLRFWAITLPLPLQESLTMLGRAAIPIALMFLGMQLATTRIQMRAKEVLVTGLRLLVSPVIAFAVARLLGLTGLDLQVFVLQSAMPVAVNSVVLVNEFGGNPALVARVTVLSTLIGLGTLPLVLWGLDGA